MVGYILSGILLLILAAVLICRGRETKRLKTLSGRMEDYLTGRGGKLPLSLKEDTAAQVENAAAEMRNRIETAEERFRQEAKRTSDLTADISHQLKTPLASLRLFCEMDRSEHCEQQLSQIERMETLISSLLRLEKLCADGYDFAYEECDVRKILCIDLLTPLLMKLSAYLECPPRGTPGLLHSLNERYYRRIEAVDFSVKHDDGQELRTLYLADIILIGVSRSGKTPLSMYLANSGWKVANVPIIKGIAPPEELFSAACNRVICLTIDPQRLLELRIARLRNLHQSTDSVYANLEQIIEELDFVKSLCKKQGWPMVDVSEKAVEETANDILTKLQLK